APRPTAAFPSPVPPPWGGRAPAATPSPRRRGVARRILEGDRLVRKSVFPGGQSNYLTGSRVYGRTLGLVGGGGRIGKAVARRARGFALRVLYWTPRRQPEAEESEARLTYLAVDQLLARSGLLSL